jgi:hypothetical protein
VLLLAGLVAVVVPNDLVEESSKLLVVVGGHGVAAKARVLVVNSSPDTPVEGLEVVIGESLALLGVEEGDEVLAAPVSGLRRGGEGWGQGGLDWKTMDESVEKEHVRAVARAPAQERSQVRGEEAEAPEWRGEEDKSDGKKQATQQTTRP